MRYGWLLVLAACGKSDGRFDPNHCPALGSAPGPVCTAARPTCGDGILQNCWFETLGVDGPCPWYAQHEEQCDGSDVPTCAALGKGPGIVSCSADCATANTSACGACGDDPRVVECAVAPGLEPQSGWPLLVASDPAVVGGPYLAAAYPTDFWVLQHGAQGFSDVYAAEVPLQFATVSVAPAPDGWFIAGASSTGEVSVIRSDVRATTATSQVVTAAASVGAVSIAYGPGGHALVAWVEYVPDASSVMHPQTRFAIVDTTGAVIGAPATLFPSTDDAAGTSVTTDGTSFFVAASGKLARITSAGSVAAVLTGFPTIADPLSRVAPAVRWGTSTGWFAVQQASGQPWSAQAFDATGATTGNVVATASAASAPVVVGDNLVTATAGTQTGLTVALSLNVTPVGGTATRSIPVGSTAVAVGFADHTALTTLAGNVAVLFHSNVGPLLALVATGP